MLLHEALVASGRLGAFLDEQVQCTPPLWHSDT